MLKNSCSACANLVLDQYIHLFAKHQSDLEPHNIWNKIIWELNCNKKLRQQFAAPCLNDCNCRAKVTSICESFCCELEWIHVYKESMCFGGKACQYMKTFSSLNLQVVSEYITQRLADRDFTNIRRRRFWTTETSINTHLGLSSDI